MSGIHAHEVLELIEQFGGQQEKPALRQKVVEKFGDGAVFANCSGRQFTFDELIDFFQNKGRIHIKGDLIVLNPGEEEHCQH